MDRKLEEEGRSMGTAQITRRMAHALAEDLDGQSVERWNAVAGEDGARALFDLGLIRRGRGETEDEYTGCLYRTDAGERAHAIAVDHVGEYLTREDWRLTDDAFAGVAEQIAAVAGRDGG